MDKKTLRNDIILIASLLLVAVISLVVVLSTRTSVNVQYANVYVANELVQERIPLNVENSYTVHGINGDLTVQTKNGKIAVTKSNCPHQDCVNMGYVGEKNHPIICAYNQVYVIIEGDAD